MPKRYGAKNVRQRRLEALAVAVLTALGERDGAVRDAEKRAAEALRTMTDEKARRWAKRWTSAAAAALRRGK